MEIGPSLLSADFAVLGEQLRTVLAEGVTRIHVDVMDGHFVPNLSMGPHVVRCLQPLVAAHTAKLDIHMMVEQPERFLDAFADAGASALCVHVETCPQLARVVEQIHTLGLEAGVALNPASPLHLLDEILPELDYVLLMCVNPGFGGQHLLPWTLPKITRLRRVLQDRHLPRVSIQVDGGVHLETVADVARAGADRAVAGLAVFEPPDDTAHNLRRLRDAARAGAQI